MAELVLTRGLPGSGKTTIAKAWVAEDPDKRARLNRDDLRRSLYDGEGILPYAQEEVITKVQEETAAALLQQGTSVIVDDMNLRAKYVKNWLRIARKTGAEFRTFEVDTSVEECIAQDKARGEAGGRLVGEKVIRDIANRFPKRHEPVVIDHGFDIPKEVYTREDGKGLPRAILVDIDGTLAKNVGRGWYDWPRVGEDEPIQNIIELVAALSENFHIIIMSGRDEEAREPTVNWLHKHGVYYNEGPFMRPLGDMRKDSVVKKELFDKHVRGHYDVVGVLDDRQAVVDMWRDSLGLTVLQVAPGDF